MSRTGLAALVLILAVGWLGSSAALASKSSFVDFGPSGATYYTSVRFQQGRVQLDEDFNESACILEISAAVDPSLQDYVQFPAFPNIPLGFLSNTGERENTIFRFMADRCFLEAVSNPEGFPIEIIIPPNTEHKPTTLFTSTFTVVPLPNAVVLLGPALLGLVIWKRFGQG
jgi:hypothetical protein